MKNVIVTLLVGTLLGSGISGCMAPKPKRPNDYGEYPTIQLLPYSQAGKVSTAPNARIEGRQLTQEDWEQIVSIISRIPNLTDFEREVICVWTASVPDQTVGVQVQLRGYTVVLVKLAQNEWKITGIYSYHI